MTLRLRSDKIKSMPKHHSKLDNFLIHLVVILFTFSSIVALFLGYGVYQSRLNIGPAQTLLNPGPTKAAGPAHKTWVQNSWTGSTSSSTLTVSWNTDGGWNKYSSATNVTINSAGIQDDGTGTGELISSIFNLGSEKLASITLDNSGTVQVKSGNSVSEVQSASWTSLNCPNNHKYLQYKLTNLPTGFDNNISLVALESILVTISGTVKDASTDNTISGATVSYGNNSTTTALNPSNNNAFIRTAHAAVFPPGYYSLSFGYASTTTYSITASASGYQSQSKTINVSQGVGCSYSATANFSLSKTSSSSSPTSSPTGSTSTGTAVDTSPSVSLSEFQKTKLPKIFLAKDSKTTNLSKVKDHKKIKNFTLDIPGKNKIVFTED